MHRFPATRGRLVPVALEAMAAATVGVVAMQAGIALGVGRSGTPSQGKIYLLFAGGPKSWDEAVQVAVFNLSWLLDGRDITPLLGIPR